MRRPPSLRRERVAEDIRVGVVEPGTVDTEPVGHLSDTARDTARGTICRRIAGIETPRPADVADAIGHIATRERRVAVSEPVVRAGRQHPVAAPR